MRPVVSIPFKLLAFDADLSWYVPTGGSSTAGNRSSVSDMLDCNASMHKGVKKKILPVIWIAKNRKCVYPESAFSPEVSTGSGRQTPDLLI